MALDPEELKRRRQAQRQQRKARQRALILRLCIALAVLVVCGVLIAVLGKPAAPMTAQVATEDAPLSTEQTQAAAESEPAGEDAPTTTVRLKLAGDLNITDRVVASGGSEYNYTATFLDVVPVLSDADLTVLNFEGNLVGSPYGAITASAPQQMMQALERAGVDLVQLANSYSIHNGVSGLRSTINAVNAAGVEPLGVYSDQAAYQAGKGYTIRQVQGIKIAFVAFTKGMDGMALPAGNAHCVNVLYTDYDSTYQTIDRDGITRILEDVQRERPDLTVALLHWGSEFNNTISKSQENIAQLLRQNGVDVIVGTHSHYVQKVEFDPQTGHLAAYSLGDFCGDANRAGSEYSVILELEVTRDNRTKTTRVTGWDYTPIFTVNEPDKPLRVVQIPQAMQAYENGFIDRVSQSTYDAMAYAIQRIEARLAGE